MDARLYDAGLGPLPRARLALLPTPLERGPELPGGARLWVKRDDLTGLGMGGNKARKLEFLCGEAIREAADTLVTTGAAQSNHCRMTAAAGAVLGMETHLVIATEPRAAAPSGDRPPGRQGNQLLSALFGAAFHDVEGDWTVAKAHLDEVAASLSAAGRRPYTIPLGGSAPVGDAGFALAFSELMHQADARNARFAAIVHATSTMGTQAGLVAGRALWRAAGPRAGLPARRVPAIVGVDVAGVNVDEQAAQRLAARCLEKMRRDPGLVRDGDVEIVRGFAGEAYAAPTPEADEAIHWAARHGGWVLDRTYTAKAFAALLALAASGRFGPGDDVVFWHTGGQPALFAPGGAPAATPSLQDAAAAAPAAPAAPATADHA